jgi:hypothetical protein
MSGVVMPAPSFKYALLRAAALGSKIQQSEKRKAWFLLNLFLIILNRRCGREIEIIRYEAIGILVFFLILKCWTQLLRSV